MLFASPGNLAAERRWAAKLRPFRPNLIISSADSKLRRERTACMITLRAGVIFHWRFPPLELKSQTIHVTN